MKMFDALVFDRTTYRLMRSVGHNRRWSFMAGTQMPTIVAIAIIGTYFLVGSY